MLNKGLAWMGDMVDGRNRSSELSLNHFLSICIIHGTECLGLAIPLCCAQEVHCLSYACLRCARPVQERRRLAVICWADAVYTGDVLSRRLRKQDVRGNVNVRRPRSTLQSCLQAHKLGTRVTFW